MRISTTQIYTQGIEAFQRQQVKLAKLQQQISSGVRLGKPSDDPAAASRMLQMEQSVSLTLQYQVNIGLAEQRLEREETALASIETLLFRVRELTIQAGDGALDFNGLAAIGQEIGQRREELLALANTRDNNGDFLFAGYQNGTRPFVERRVGSISEVVYNGDQGQRLLQISETRQLEVDDPGSEIFLRLPSALALNETTAAANTGSGVMAPAHVFDASVYVAGDYEIRFTGPATYDVFDVGLGANIVTGAAYVDGADLDFQGIRTSITGAPAAGDVFTVSQGQYRDIFESLQTIVDTLESSVSAAQRGDNIAATLNELDTFLGRVLETRTEIGGRLNSLETQRDSNEAIVLDTQSALSELRDTDLAEAISKLSLEQTTLEAAQAVFARLSRSSLFNFLR